MNAVVAEGLVVDPGVEALGVSLPLAVVDEPGTYVCDWSGHLLRVPETDRGASRFATVCEAGSRRWTVTRISPDPQLSRFEARALAHRFGLIVNF